MSDYNGVRDAKVREANPVLSQLPVKRWLDMKKVDER